MTHLTRNRLIGLFLAVIVFGTDQYVKWLMVGPLQLRQRSVIDLLPVFDLRWTQNYGVSLGMFTATSMEMQMVLIGVTSLIALVVTIWLLREKYLLDITGLALILGGALGNIKDRYELGYVIDYADLHFGEFRPFLIFNIADAAITIGVLIILARSFFARDKKADIDTTPVSPAAEI